MKAVLDMNELRTCGALHASLAEQFCFPDYYGRNLDALFDCLTDLPEAELQIKNAGRMAENMGETYARRFFRVLDAASREGHLHLKILS